VSDPYRDDEIMFAVPTRGLVDWNLVNRMLELQERHPAVTYWTQAGRLSVSDCRHRIVTRFLATDRRLLIMCDDDVIPRLALFDRMRESPYPITGATYLIVRHEFTLPFPAVFRLDVAHHRYAPLDHVFGRAGRVPCDAVGTGCIAIRREVLETLRKTDEAPFAMHWDADGVMRTSDDLAFCGRARAAGFAIAADYDLHADHVIQGLSMNLLQTQYGEAYAKARELEQRQPRLVVPGGVT